MLTKPFTVRLVEDPEQVGIVVSEHLLPTPSKENPQVIEYKCQLGVLWDSARTPAITYWSPEQLEWVAVMDVAQAIDEDDEYEEDEEDDEVTEVIEPQEVQQ